MLKERAREQKEGEERAARRADPHAMRASDPTPLQHRVPSAMRPKAAAGKRRGDADDHGAAAANPMRHSLPTLQLSTAV